MQRNPHRQGPNNHNNNNYRRGNQNQQQQPQRQQQQNQQQRNFNQQNKLKHEKLPKYLTFPKNNNLESPTSKKYQNILWPMNEKIVVDFFPKAKVPVLYIDSTDPQLSDYLQPHKQDTVLIDMEWKGDNPASLFLICSCKGLLIIHNSGKSEVLCNFIRTTPFVTKGSTKLQKFQEYLGSDDFQVTEIDENYIFPKRFPRGFDYLVQKFLDKPSAVFRNKSLASSDWSIKELSCSQIMCCSYKAVCEYMLIPIVIAAPKTIDEQFKTQAFDEYANKTLDSWKSIQTPFSFFNDKKKTFVTFIPTNEEEEKFIAPMIEKLYDGKSFIISNSEEYYGYGTSLGILITDKQIQNFSHVQTPCNPQSIEQHQNDLMEFPEVNELSSDSLKLLNLARYIATSVKYVKRQDDPVKGKAKMPSFAKFKPAKFDMPEDIDIPHNFPVYHTILPFNINKELYPSFALPILKLIQCYQEMSIRVPKAEGFDIDDMINCIQVGDFSDELEDNINKLIDSFPKISPDDLLNKFLLNINPNEEDEDFYSEIIENPDLSTLTEKQIYSFLNMMNYMFKERNLQMKNMLERIASKPLTNDERRDAENILNQLLCFTDPSLPQELRNKYLTIVSKQPIRTNSFNELLFFVQSLTYDNEGKKERIISLIKKAKENFIKFSKTNNTYIDQMNKIITSIINLTRFDASNNNNNEIKLFFDNLEKVLNAIITYTTFMNAPTSYPMKTIENLLFDIVFTPSEDESPFTQVYSVYQMHDDFLYNNDRFVNFKSSTGSGKTRCAPFFFSIRALLDRMQYPFFIMTQPGASIIQDKMSDFKAHLGDNVQLVSNVYEMIQLYKHKERVNKPVIGLFSPFNVLRILTALSPENVIPLTRFCLDEIHERSVYTDVLISILSSTMNSQQGFGLQLLMMSATPDPRVLHCFGEVKQLEMPDSQLFPIKTIKQEVEKRNSISEEASKQAFECLKKMSTGEQEKGHIIIFTSGNSRINEIERSLNKTYETLPDNSYHIKMLKNIPLDENFDESLNNVVGSDNQSLYVIPIKFAGFVSTQQKEIAKRVIKNHKNVIKIIIATNAIESSITIDELSVVIDTGLFNQPSYNPNSGITALSEEPISIQSQTQRKGRVGRVRPGVSVQFSIKGLKFKDCLPPEIQTTDISSAILSLRQIKIKLETLSNLPDKVPPQQLERYMNELYSFNAIDPISGDITEVGRNISKFESISPFLSSAIMKTSEKFKGDGAYSKELLEVLGSLIVLIFNNSELVCDVTSAKLQKNFDENSDIITVLKTFLDVTQEVKPRSWKRSTNSYGLNPKSFIQITSVIQNIAKNLNVEVESPFQEIFKISQSIDLMNFIQSIINCIAESKPEWVQCRKVEFYTLEDMLFNPTIVYVGDESLSFKEDEPQSKILVRMRPGAKGFSAPGLAYVMNISHNDSMQTNYASYVHRNLKEDPIIVGEENYSFVKPKIYVSDYSLFAQEEFSKCLLEAMLLDSQDKFHKFNLFHHSGKESGKLLFHISQFNENGENKSIFTYAPQDKNANELFIKSVQSIALLMPFTPSTILVRHPILQCAIAVRYHGSKLPNNSIYFFKNSNCYPYQINKETLQYMISHVNELSNIQNQTYIAITGEMFSFPLYSENTSSDYQKIRRPTIDPKCNFVFSDDEYFYSHMVILSQTPIPHQTPIPWTKSGIYADIAPEDYITRIANGIFPELFKVTKSGTRVFFIDSNLNEIQFEGNYPISLQSDIVYSYNHDRLIDSMFDRFAMGCIEKDKLVKDVDLKSFQTQGIQLPSDLIYYKKHEEQIISDYKNKDTLYNENSDQIELQIKQAENRLNQHNNSVNDFGSLSKQQRIAFINTQNQLEIQLYTLQRDIAPVTEKPIYNELINNLQIIGSTRDQNQRNQLKDRKQST